MPDLTQPGTPRMLARVAGLFYLVTFVAGSLALRPGTLGAILNIVATLAYIAVTLLFYALFRPVNRSLSLLAAVVGLAGCGWSLLRAAHLAPAQVNPLAFFGVYCLLVGALILRSTFLPRALGAFMMLGGVGWLTFAVPPLAHQIAPFNMLPGVVGEGLLTLWLVSLGVDEPRWREQAVGGVTPAARAARS